MVKTAIFLEGQSELIFTRELILKFFEYSSIRVECYNLFNDSNLNSTEYSFSAEGAAYYFQLLNVGNDSKVLSSILKRERYLFSGNQAFDKIIGLRDMYSAEYKNVVKQNKIDPEVISRFIKKHQETITKKSAYSDKIRFHFAIMELEAWLLGISDFFERVHPMLTNTRIKQLQNIDLSEIDPENEIFHPAEFVDKIFSDTGEGYDKKSFQLNKFMGIINRDDITNLLTSNKCKSFKSYCESIGIRTN